MKNRKNIVFVLNGKKAELTTSQIAGIILILMGFAIISLIFYQLASTQSIDREVCHESVVIRGTLPDSFAGEAKEAFPLKCKTRKICFTTKVLGNGECEDSLGKSFDTVRVSSNSEKIEEEINKFLAREMADCWSMMGEGNIQVFSRDAQFFDYTKKCSVCSRIAFDNSVQKEISKVHGLGFYLIQHKVPNKEISYWDYLTTGASYNGFNPLEDYFLTNEEKAIVFIEFGDTALPDYITALGGGIVVGIAGGKFLGPKGATIGFAAGAYGGFSLVETIREGAEIKKFYSGNFLINYNSEEFNEKLKCDSLENIP